MKKIKNWFKNLFATKVIVVNLQVVETSDEEDIAGSLGITPERREEIANSLKEEDFHNCKSTVARMVWLSSYCKNANELAYVSFLLGLDYERSRNPLAGLMSMFGRYRI